MDSIFIIKTENGLTPRIQKQIAKSLMGTRLADNFLNMYEFGGKRPADFYDVHQQIRELDEQLAPGMIIPMNGASLDDIMDLSELLEERGVTYMIMDQKPEPKCAQPAAHVFIMDRDKPERHISALKHENDVYIAAEITSDVYSSYKATEEGSVLQIQEVIDHLLKPSVEFLEELVATKKSLEDALL